jgi:hypothetical protein
VSDRPDNNPEPYVDGDDDHDLDHDNDDGDRGDPEIPTTLEDAIAALERERKNHSATRKESIQRRTRLREAEKRVTELEARDSHQWRTAALVAMVESEAVKQGARRPEVVGRLVDLDELDSDNADELRLRIAGQVTAVLDGAPELKRSKGQLGAISPGPRQRERRRDPADVNARIRKSLQR